MAAADGGHQQVTSIPLGRLLLPDRRATLVRRVRLLVVFTIAYNVIESVVALLAGSASDSSALIGFGLDSLVEVASALAVAWQFSGSDHERRERVALRIIALSFFALAAFVSYDAISSLATRQAAEHSRVGIVLAVLSLAIMPAASWFQRRTGRELGSHSAVADSKQTLLCTYMSAVLLFGLVANSTLGWWWADPVAALAIAGLAVREGVNAWRGEVCCAPTEALMVHGAPAQDGPVHGAPAHDGPDRDGCDRHACACGPTCTTC